VTTKLNGPLRREIEVDGKAHTLTIDGAGMKITEKGHRKGLELSWKALLNGDAAVAAELRASLQSGSGTPAA
jgi:hypothetical protein